MPHHISTTRNFVTGILLCLACCIATVAAPPAARADTDPHLPELPETVSATVQPAPQINGVAWTVKIHRGLGFVGGQFNVTRPFKAAPGQQETPVSNFLAFNLKTGERDPKFSNSFNGTIQDIMPSPDGNTLYVSGSFTKVDGQSRYRMAAIDMNTGQLTNFAPTFDYVVNSIATHGSSVYVGGKFSSVNGQPRQNLAAISANGTLLPWAPSANMRVQSLVVSPDGSRVVVAGHFTELAGRQALGWGAVDANTGAGLPWRSNQVLTNSGKLAAMYDLEGNQDGVYVTGYAFGTHNFEGLASADWDGNLRWVKACKGDSYGVSAMDGVAYGVHHTHDCDPLGGIPQVQPWIYQRADAVTTSPSPFGRVNHGGSHNGHVAPEFAHWFPEFPAGTYTGQNQAAWAVDAQDGYALLGGEFPRVNGIRQYGIALFAKKDLAPATSGPRPTNELAPNLTVGERGKVTVTFRGLYDQDSYRLTYELLRGDTLVASTTIDGNYWWNRKNGSLSDPSPVDGKHEYRVRVTDARGNSFTSAPLQADVAGAPKPSKYADMVRADGAVHLWRLGEATGTVAYDDAGSNHLNLTSDARRGTPGAIKDEEDTATSFSGSGVVPGAATQPARGPQSFGLEAWFKTTSQRGGVIMNYGSSRTGSSWNRDRMLYLNNAGNVLFGVYDGWRVNHIKSPKTYNDGQWHHVSIGFTRDGLIMHVDGAKVAAKTGSFRAEDFHGYWRIGGESLFGWPETPRSANFEGTLDEIAVYPKPLTADQIKAHSGSAPPPVEDNTPPEAVFTRTVNALEVKVDGGSSRDVDGSIVNYAWDFGDGKKAEGVAVTHTYEAAGTYTLRLTVTDDKGATHSTSRQVSVAPEGQNPGGDDPGNLGDGTKAKDTFDRTASFSWGNPEIGGSWSMQGNPVSFSVKDSKGIVEFPRPGTQRSVWLQQIATDKSALYTNFEVSDAVTGGGLYLGIVSRAVGTDQYKARVKLLANGDAQLSIRRAQGASETSLGAVPAAKGVTKGTKIHIKTEAIGANPTKLAAKLWLDGTDEPAEWQVSAEDSTPSLQKPGYVGIVGYLSSSAQSLLGLRFDDYTLN